MALRVSGECSPTGFTLTIADDDTRVILASGDTKHYDARWFSEYDEVFEEVEDTFWSFTESSLSLFLLALLGTRKDRHTVTAILGARLFRSFLIATYDILQTAVEFSDSPMWSQQHGCEHKLAWLYEHDLPRTREELLRAPRVTPHCNTKEIAVKIVGSAGAAAQFLAAQTDSKTRAALLLLVGELIVQRGTDALSLLLQKYLLTADPTEEQMAEALELAAILDAKIIETRQRQTAEAAEPEAEAETET